VSRERKLRPRHRTCVASVVSRSQLAQLLQSLCVKISRTRAVCRRYRSNGSYL